MSKAVLVIENPSLCLCCPIVRYSNVKGPFECNHYGKEVTYHEFYYKKPEWCPLVELPQKKEVCGKYPQKDGRPPSYKIGYNDCIDDILKEVENGKNKRRLYYRD